MSGAFVICRMVNGAVWHEEDHRGDVTSAFYLGGIITVVEEGLYKYFMQLTSKPELCVFNR